ncbi:two-component system sensor histidine kinase NtrB [Lachnotalea glycerini]|nr:ATP-binding protein [Lachnotalea glycerini]
MLNNDDRQKMEKLMKISPEFNCLILKIIEEYKFNISKFSHELRNPITLINSSLQLIESQHPEVKTFKFWNETMADIQYVRLLLDELSTYNQSNTLNITEFNIRELLDSICTGVCNDFKTSAKTFSCNFSESLPTMTGDPVKIRQVISNLLKNAKDAINPENGSISITAFCKDQENIQIQISDNGCGIPPEYQSSVFEPFITHKENGSGLGLSICQKVIESHHGIITFKSQVNKGTTFYITLPIHLQC